MTISSCHCDVGVNYGLNKVRFTNPVLEAVELCKQAGAARCVPLEVSGAFHSSCMRSACLRIEEALKLIPVVSPRISVVSNLTAEVESDPAQIKKNLVMRMKTTFATIQNYLRKQS